MLNGLDIDKSPLEVNPAIGKTLSILYQDQDIVVVNKPAEFLSVSGKTIKDSVEQRIKELFPDAKGPLIVHRLDMSTSGLLVLTLTALANKKLQQQFISRTVKKRYTALIEGEIGQDSGTISLPLTGDLLDRPRQMVSHEKGRVATTHFEVIKRMSKQTLIHLYPVTGRTHQLRVHCAHKDGLNSPIVGDDLYGFKNRRLHLHAGYIEFAHPITNNIMKFEVDSDF
jgi:tRNA pseudouridine32 synthase/23S rRNA pseudouridine746 synthase